jgi:hypothetical protein
MKVITVVVLALALAFVFAPAVFADGTHSTFDYIGTPFTEGTTLGGDLTGSLTINGTLPANAVNLQIIPTNFSFTDGFSTWNPESSPNTEGGFFFSTDSQGNIIGWSIDITSLFFDFPIFQTFETELTSSWTGGVGLDGTDSIHGFNTAPIYFEESFTAGTWTDPVTGAVAATTPEPPAYLFALAGIGLFLALAARRRTATLSDSENGGLQ